MRRRWAVSYAALACAALAGVATRPAAAAERDPGEPIQVRWMEGDVAGLSRIMSADGKQTIGFVDFHQQRRGDVIEMVRVARFKDGSSDEDQAEARVGKTLEGLRGRTIIRNTKGKPTLDLQFDVTAGHISGFYEDDKGRHTVDEDQKMPAGTYWGPLIFVVIKNFEENAAGDRLVFTSVVPTPKPRVLHMELLRGAKSTLQRPGGHIDVVQFTLRPTVNFLIDPIIHRIAPETKFLVEPGKPPGWGRFIGPRNFAGQMIEIE